MSPDTDRPAVGTEESSLCGFRGVDSAEEKPEMEVLQDSKQASLAPSATSHREGGDGTWELWGSGGVMVHS